MHECSLLLVLLRYIPSPIHPEAMPARIKDKFTCYEGVLCPKSACNPSISLARLPRQLVTYVTELNCGKKVSRFTLLELLDAISAPP